MQKKIVIVPSLICLVMAAIVYIMIYKPLTSDIEIIKTDLEMAELEYSTKQKRIDTITLLNKEAKKMIENSNYQFYGETPQEELIVKINDLCAASEVRVLEISYSGLSEFNLEAAENEAAEAEPKESGEDTAESETAQADTAESEESETQDAQTETPDESLLYGDIFTVKFAGTFEQILSILNSIDNNDKKIVNAGIEINTELDVTSQVPEELTSRYPDVNFDELMIEEGVLSCQMQLIFFQLKGMEEYVVHDYNILEEEPREKSILESPFDVYIDESLRQYE